MQIETAVGTIQDQRADVLAVNLFEGVTNPGGAAGAVDAALMGKIGRLLALGDFKGKAGELAVIYPDGMIPAKRVILVGLGHPQDLSPSRLRHVSGEVAKRARDLGASNIYTIVHGAGIGGLDVGEATQALVEGAILALYRFQELKTKKPERSNPGRLVLVDSDASKMKAIELGALKGQVIAESSCFARDLVNLPANELTPLKMAEIAINMGGITGLEVSVLEEREIAQKGMNAFLSVARGSHRPPRFIILEHRGGKSGEQPVVLVGKAVTFDSGGISLKPGAGMERMKTDMAGGAAVMAAMRAAVLLRLPLNVVGFIPAVENMPGGRASRPGDVVKSLMGLTVEIISTDAEGRLCLADALTFAGDYNPAAIVDIATLTGASNVALGDQAAAVMGDASLVDALRQAGEESGERVWPLPLFEGYHEQIKSHVADIKNTGGRGGGAITAGCFLQRFVKPGPVWAHIDMAGCAFSEKSPEGATGYGVMLLSKFLDRWAER